jgi:ribonuclease BN (tRNA processing enzyme)
LFKEWPLQGTGTYAQRTVQSIPALHDPHASPTSIKISSQSHSLVFSGDTGWNEKLVELSAGTDALIMECSFQDHIFDGHISLAEIEKYRSTLTSKRLILTHFGERSRAAAVEKQALLKLEVADDGVVWNI